MLNYKENYFIGGGWYIVKRFPYYWTKYNKRRIELGYDVLAVPPRLKAIGMQPGDSIVLITTRKPSREQLISEVSHYFAVRLYEKAGSSQVIVAASRKQVS